MIASPSPSSTSFALTSTGAALVTPSDVGASDVEGLLAWLESARDEVIAASHARGAVVLRGFGVLTPSAFEGVAVAVDPGWIPPTHHGIMPA